MDNFSATLVREKFTIKDLSQADDEGNNSLVALGNRMVVDLTDAEGKPSETFIVRGHNMHLTTRMAARIIQAFTQDGPIMTRVSPFDWEGAWRSIVNDYEFAYNPSRWIAIYHDGKIVYESGERNPFLDVVEKCDLDNTLDYDFAIPMAEELLRQTGKNLKIEYDANVALNSTFEDNVGRCGIILRGSIQTTTFSFSVSPRTDKQAANIPQTLASAAAFLEGIQLAFNVGFDTEKVRLGIIQRHSKEEQKVRDGRARLSRLRTEISNLETAFEVRYRPEKPEFDMYLNDAEEMAQKVLAPPEEADDEDTGIDLTNAEESETEDLEHTDEGKEKE